MNTQRIIRRHTKATAAAASLLVAVAMIGATAPSASAALLPKPPPPAKYSIKAVFFEAVDESEWDGDFYFPISDEPYFIFSSVGTEGTASTTVSRTFDDVDSGETRHFSSSEGCLWGGASCAGATAPVGVGVSIATWESDIGLTENTWDKTRDAFATVGPILSPTDSAAWTQRATPKLASVNAEVFSPVLGAWIDDDHLGTVTWAFSPEMLKGLVPFVGSTLLLPLAMTNGDADYTVFLWIKRTA